MPEQFKALQGFKDILPDEQPYWRYVEHIAAEKEMYSFNDRADKEGKSLSPEFASRRHSWCRTRLSGAWHVQNATTSKALLPERPYVPAR